jgi:hypothetical protein
MFVIYGAEHNLIEGNTISNAVLDGLTMNNRGSDGHQVSDNIIRNNIFSNPAGSFIGFIVSDPTLINSDYNIFYDLDAESDIFNTTLGLSEWQSATGQDTHSTFGNPLFTSGVHLSNTASGQGSTSPGVDAADESALTGYDIVDIGTTRTDATSDELNNLDIGYHYNFTYLETTENPPSSRRMILQY